MKALVVSVFVLAMTVSAPALARDHHHSRHHRDHAVYHVHQDQPRYIILVDRDGDRGRGRDHDRWERHHDDDDDDDYYERHHRGSDVIVLERDPGISMRFGSDDFNVIVNWFGSNRYTVSEWQDLPPGLHRQLRDRGHLPPGLAMKSLPPGLARRLGPPPRGFDSVVIGHDVALIELSSGAIADIIRDVL